MPKNKGKRNLLATLKMAASPLSLSNSKKNKEANKNTEINIMTILISRNNAVRNEVMLVELGLGSNKTIGDFIRKIPLYATDPILRSQRYTNVCTKDGVVLKNTTPLEQCFAPIREGLYHVVIAIPHGNTCNEVIRLAYPILMDSEIAKMTNRQYKIDDNDRRLSIVSELSEDSFLCDCY